VGASYPPGRPSLSCLQLRNLLLDYLFLKLPKFGDKYLGTVKVDLCQKPNAEKDASYTIGQMWPN